MAYQSIFSSDLGQAVLAFLLVFTIVFAVLQKSKILGDGKKQIDALVALAIGLIVISIGTALDFIQRIIPFLGISLVIILVFLILLGAFFKEGSFDVPPWLKVVFGIIIFIAVAIAVLMFTPGWDYITSWFGESGSWGTNIIFVIVIVIAIVVALIGGGKSDKKD